MDHFFDVLKASAFIDYISFMLAKQNLGDFVNP